MIMRELFPGHYRRSDSELENIWNTAHFVFDTNVLLECYALPEKARDELLAVLEAIKDRIWVPYQVGLEFHRRRFNKIRDASKELAELRKMVKSAPAELSSGINRLDIDKWNIGISNMPELLKSVIAAYEQIDKALVAAEQKLPKISLADPIAERISDLVATRIGAPPASQKELDEQFATAAQRYAAKIPPGFSDYKKDEVFNDKGLVYQAKYGDYLLWKQLIAHTKSAGLKHVIFVTGDVKEDWWHSERSGERLGPHPALVEEFVRQTGAESFWIYTPGHFVDKARKLFELDVADQTIEQVDQGILDVIANRFDTFHEDSRLITDYIDETRPAPAFSELKQMREWVQLRHPNSILTAGLGIDIAVTENNELTDAYQALKVRRTALIGPKLAAIDRFPGVRHHAVVILNRDGLAEYIFGNRKQILSEIQQVILLCGFMSVVLADFTDGRFTVFDEIAHPQHVEKI